MGGTTGGTVKEQQVIFTYSTVYSLGKWMELTNKLLEAWRHADSSKKGATFKHWKRRSFRMAGLAIHMLNWSKNNVEHENELFLSSTDQVFVGKSSGACGDMCGISCSADTVAGAFSSWTFPASSPPVRGSREPTWNQSFSHVCREEMSLPIPLLDLTCSAVSGFPVVMLTLCRDQQDIAAFLSLIVCTCYKNTDR